MRISNLAGKMKAEGLDIVSLSAGEPDFPTPAHVNQAGIDAINAGFTRYTANSGIAELKKAIVEKFRRDMLLIFRKTRLSSAMVANRPLQTPFLPFAKRVMR